MTAIRIFGAAALVLALCTSSSSLYAFIGGDELIVLRGDANNDGNVDGSDVVFLGSWLSSNGAAPPCKNQADVNYDGSINISDQAYLANYLYQGGPQPPYPGPRNGTCVYLTHDYISCDTPPSACSP